jgi:TctA family transporter
MFGRFAIKIVVTDGDLMSRSCAIGSAASWVYSLLFLAIYSCVYIYIYIYMTYILLYILIVNHRYARSKMYAPEYAN